MDSYEFSIFENIERTQLKVKQKLESTDAGEFLGNAIDERWKSNLLDLNNHLGTQLQELRHYNEVVKIHPTHQAAEDAINKEIASW